MKGSFKVKMKIMNMFMHLYTLSNERSFFIDPVFILKYSYQSKITMTIDEISPSEQKRKLTELQFEVTVWSYPVWFRDMDIEAKTDSKHSFLSTMSKQTREIIMKSNWCSTQCSRKHIRQCPFTFCTYDKDRAKSTKAIKTADQSCLPLTAYF